MSEELSSPNARPVQKPVGYMPNGEAVTRLCGRVTVGDKEWEIIHTWYRDGCYGPTGYGTPDDNQAIHTLRRDAPPGEAVPGLTHAYASLTIMNEVVSLSVQGEGYYRLSEEPPAATDAA